MKNLWILGIGIFMTACNHEFDPVFRDHMRDFVIELGNYARENDPGFIVIPQNGHELAVTGEDLESSPAFNYISAIDGAGQEDLFFGYSGDNRPTPNEDTEYLSGMLDIYVSNDVVVLVTDYCDEAANINSSYELNSQKGYVSFAAADRELRIISAEPPYKENQRDILELGDLSNFLYLINPEDYNSKEDFLDAISATNYDLLIIDLFFEKEILDSADISKLTTKENGGKRLIIAYMSIGEAEDYRYYWQESWTNDKPDWLLKENRDWAGNFKVEYWNQDWKKIIFGQPESYLDRIIKAGFDGVYLDIIEAFEYFE